MNEEQMKEHGLDPVLYDKDLADAIQQLANEITIHSDEDCYAVVKMELQEVARRYLPRRGRRAG